jgi:hypothetical protein
LGDIDWGTAIHSEGFQSVRSRSCVECAKWISISKSIYDIFLPNFASRTFLSVAQKFQPVFIEQKSYVLATKLSKLFKCQESPKNNFILILKRKLHTYT